MRARMKLDVTFHGSGTCRRLLVCAVDARATSHAFDRYRETNSLGQIDKHGVGTVAAATFTFDNVFGPDARTEDLYESVCGEGALFESRLRRCSCL
jgi:hypothetical protein